MSMRLMSSIFRAHTICPSAMGASLQADMNRAEDAVLGGWSVNFIYSYQSGQPFNIPCATSTTADFGCNADVVEQPGRLRWPAQPHAMA